MFECLNIRMFGFFLESVVHQVRICVGHYPNDSYDHPAKLSGANTRMLLEVRQKIIPVPSITSIGPMTLMEGVTETRPCGSGRTAFSPLLLLCPPPPRLHLLCCGCMWACAFSHKHTCDASDRSRTRRATTSPRAPSSTSSYSASAPTPCATAK